MNKIENFLNKGIKELKKTNLKLTKELEIVKKIYLNKLKNFLN